MVWGIGSGLWGGAPGGVLMARLLFMQCVLGKVQGRDEKKILRF